MKFCLSDILSITTGRMLSSSSHNLYTILNYMTQDNLFTHQLPRAMDECKPWLLRWYPALDVNTDKLDEFIAQFGPREGCKKFVRYISATLSIPMELEINQIPNHLYLNPIDEYMLKRENK